MKKSTKKIARKKSLKVTKMTRKRGGTQRSKKRGVQSLKKKAQRTPATAAKVAVTPLAASPSPLRDRSPFAMAAAASARAPLATVSPIQPTAAAPVSVLPEGWDRAQLNHEILEIVLRHVRAQCGSIAATATADSRTREDLQFDSLDDVELVMELEEEFKISIPDEAAEFINGKSVRLIALMVQAVKNQETLDSQPVG